MCHKKKHVQFSEFLLPHLDDGIKKIKSKLLGHQVITEGMNKDINFIFLQINLRIIDNYIL